MNEKLKMESGEGALPGVRVSECVQFHLGYMIADQIKFVFISVVFW
jgi:hypothetical protein